MTSFLFHITGTFAQKDNKAVIKTV